MIIGCNSPLKYDHDLHDQYKTLTLSDLEAHEIEVTQNLEQFSLQDGIVWQPTRTQENLEFPDSYGSGGDSALFTGVSLASRTYKYLVTQSEHDLDKIFETVSGLHILINATGTPGVICRAAISVDNLDKLWGYPESWENRDSEFVNIGPPITNLFNQSKEYFYYTRATKDQLTGILFGLTIAWKELEDIDNPKVELIRIEIANIVESVFSHLEKNDFMIVNENGKNDTTADRVDGLQRLQLLAIYRETVNLTNSSRANEIFETYEAYFDSAMCRASFEGFFNFFNNYKSYFSFNLNYSRAFCVYILENSWRNQYVIKEYVKNRLWKFTGKHWNTKFTFLYAIISDLFNENLGPELIEANLSLRSLAMKPLQSLPSPLAGQEEAPNFFAVIFGDTGDYVLPPHLRRSTSYSLWQKDPWTTGSETYDSPYFNATGLDFLFAYWFGQYYGLLN